MEDDPDRLPTVGQVTGAVVGGGGANIKARNPPLRYESHVGSTFMPLLGDLASTGLRATRGGQARL